MDFKKRFDDIVDFLRPFQEIWSNEVLYQYPDLKAYPKEWLSWLGNLSEKELWQIDARSNVDLLKESPLSSFSNSIENLIDLPREEFHGDDLPSWAWNHVKEKKRHEINQVRGFLEKLRVKNNEVEVVDIGGGVGQLARILSLYHKIPVTTIDRDPHLQHLGRKRLAKYPKPEGHARLEFVETSFESQKIKSTPALLEKFTPNSVILGLHTCGPLAIEHAVVGLESPGMGFLNFACCYNKLDCERDINLSAHAKKAGLVLNNYALTLATRGHADMTLQEYRFKRRVKSYRYVLQLLAGEFNLNSNLKSVGSAVPGTYNGEFSDYALEKLSFANVEHSLSLTELDDFYKRTDIQNAFNTMFLANLIRWQLGRVIELHLLLDRALWIEEKGHRVSLKQYFDENLSPRNIGLLVLKET